MSLAQRKIELINWITSLSSEEALSQIEDLKNTSSKDLPQELLDLLTSADQETTEGLREHTSVKDIGR